MPTKELNLLTIGRSVSNH